MKYKLVIFDMDGTILNTLEDLTDSTNATLEHFGLMKYIDIFWTTMRSTVRTRRNRMMGF